MNTLDASNFCTLGFNILNEYNIELVDIWTDEYEDHTCIVMVIACKESKVKELNEIFIESMLYRPLEGSSLTFRFDSERFE